jgi:outer membrane protein OmpA-like peptidoglycan-associated protein
VTFPSGSAELTQDAMAALSPLGRALASSDLASFRFRIEGHTDSVGPRDANQALSERRAAAVRDFLVRRFSVDASRLEIIGRGEDDPLIAAGDEVAERRNRRVQVVNLGN